MILSTFILAFLSRAAGGGVPAPWLEKKLHWDGLPECLFGLVLAYLHWQVTGSWIFSLAVWGWCYGWMETGHFLSWGERIPEPRRERLSPIADFICDKLKIQKTLDDGFSPTRRYCQVFMGVKGFVIGLPFGGIPLAILWPLSYEAARGVKIDGLNEMLCGASAGIAAWLFLLIMGVA